MRIVEVIDVYEVICQCGGEFTVRLTNPDRYGCVRCCAEVELPPLWVDCELADLDAMEATLDDPWDEAEL